MMLWEKLQSLLGGGDGADKASSPGTELATAVLLYEIACADMEVADAEDKTLRDLLQAMPGIDAATSETLLEQARAVKSDAVSLHDYIDALNAQCDADDKRGIVRMIWEVAYADGVLDAHEEHMTRRLAELLYIPHSVFIQEKLAVEEKHGRNKPDA
ncbi:TerB family tellurite resistance protein [Algiphilus sp.]|uniref:tellurite resistance TerB family protein n=1 Tax=Algiphilus sp. TaxID=1872431 RepID=UPI003B52F858